MIGSLMFLVGTARCAVRPTEQDRPVRLSSGDHADAAARRPYQFSF
jgi:hypothetical protein